MTDTAICHFCGQAFMLKEDKAEKEAEAYALSVCTCATPFDFYALPVVPALVLSALCGKKEKRLSPL